MALALVSLLFPVAAAESSAKMFVSVTVVRPCRVSLEPPSAGSTADAAVPQVDCGPAPSRTERQAFRVRLCDRANREPWCLRLRELHPGHDIRTVRFD